MEKKERKKERKKEKSLRKSRKNLRWANWVRCPGPGPRRGRGVLV
jgi:hypothetical protein